MEEKIDLASSSDLFKLMQYLLLVMEGGWPDLTGKKLLL